MYRVNAGVGRVPLSRKHLNSDLGDFGNVRERHFWTKNKVTFLVLMASYLTDFFFFYDDLKLRQ